MEPSTAIFAGFGLLALILLLAWAIAMSLIGLRHGRDVNLGAKLDKDNFEFGVRLYTPPTTTRDNADTDTSSECTLDKSESPVPEVVRSSLPTSRIRRLCGIILVVAITAFISQWLTGRK